LNNFSFPWCEPNCANARNRTFLWFSIRVDFVLFLSAEIATHAISVRSGPNRKRLVSRFSIKSTGFCHNPIFFFVSSVVLGWIRIAAQTRIDFDINVARVTLLVIVNQNGWLALQRRGKRAFKFTSLGETIAIKVVEISVLVGLRFPINSNASSTLTCICVNLIFGFDFTAMWVSNNLNFKILLWTQTLLVVPKMVRHQMQKKKSWFLFTFCKDLQKMRLKTVKTRFQTP
jgi:hypothetical protein